MAVCPEVDLVLGCARTRIDSATERRARQLLAGGLDWELVTRWAGAQGVLALLYRNLVAIDAEAVPAAVMGDLKQRVRAEAQRSFVLAGELRALLEDFEARGIVGIPFKGPVLAADAYGDFLLRQFGDLDILVDHGQVEQAVTLLHALGYRQFVRDGPGPDHEMALAHPENGTVVDLHWGLSGQSFSFPLHTEELRQRAVPVAFAGTTVVGLAPEDTLIFLCAHACRHGWLGLQGVCDIAEHIGAHDEMAWDQVAQRARDLGCERMLRVGLALAADLLGTELPPGMAGDVAADAAARKLAAQARGWLLESPDRASVDHVAEVFGFHIRMREQPGERARLALRRARKLLRPGTRDRDWLPLPPWLSFAYWPLRPFRLMAEYGLRPLHRLLLHRAPSRSASRPAALPAAEPECDRR